MEPLQFCTVFKDIGVFFKSRHQVVYKVFKMKILLMVWTLEALEVHFEIKNMFRV
jgi:hypothetical protein